MNALSMESIFLILSGAVLVAGILYWFWSHIQLMQKKVHLLENAVFELRELQGGGGSQEQVQHVESEEREIPVYRDVDEGEVEVENDWPAEGSASTPLTALDATPVDLQPGGRIQVEAEEQVATDKDAQFRELFIQHEPRVPTPVVKQEVKEVGQESLESMPVKELRRLAEQRGLTGVSELRKKELLAALRNQIAPSVKADEGEGAPATASVVNTVVNTVVNEVTVERTLDLTDDAVVLE
jgi:hypothetical protein